MSMIPHVERENKPMMNIRTAAFKILLQLHLKPALTQTGRRGGDPGGRRGRRWQQGSQVETNFFFREFYKSLGLSSSSPYQSRSGSPLLTWQLPGWNSIAETEVIAKNIHSPLFGKDILIVCHQDGAWPRSHQWHPHGWPHPPSD